MPWPAPIRRHCIFKNWEASDPALFGSTVSILSPTFISLIMPGVRLFPSYVTRSPLLTTPPRPKPPVGVARLMNTARHAAIRSLTETAVINSLVSRTLVMVGARSDTSRSWLGRRFVQYGITYFASMYTGVVSFQPSTSYCWIKYPTARRAGSYSIPPTTVFPLCLGMEAVVSNSSTSIIWSLNGTRPPRVYLLTNRIPPSTCFLVAAMRMIWLKDWDAVMSQFSLRHHCFHSFPS